MSTPQNPNDPYTYGQEPDQHGQTYGQSAYGDPQQSQQEPYGQQTYGQPMYNTYGNDPSTERVAAAEKKATQALVLSIVGFLCCGILSIVGIVFGFQAKKELDANGRSSRKALAAIIIGFVSLATGIIGAIYRIKNS